MTQTPNPPAGWYPQGNQERWWDGTGWSDNFRPLGSEQTPQPGQPAVAAGYAQPAYGQPAYGQPTYGQPQPYLTQPVKQSHTARNILIVFAVLFLLFVGGCIAVVAVVGNKVNDAVNDDTLGGPNNPLTITEGQAFEVDGFEYADGWTSPTTPVSGPVQIENLKVTNHRGKADRLFVEIKLLNGSEIVATATCTAGDFDKIPEDTTVTVDCIERRPAAGGLRQDHDPGRRSRPAQPTPAGRPRRPAAVQGQRPPGEADRDAGEQHGCGRPALSPGRTPPRRRRRGPGWRTSRPPAPPAPGWRARRGRCRRRRR